MNKTQLAGVVVVLTMCLATANADQWNKKTVMTFSGPVGVPGVALSPGTYVFALGSPNGNRNIVRITNKEGTVTYAMVLTIPDYRVKPTDKTVVEFGERAPGAPPAIKVWFYPGENYGWRFIYPKVEAMELAKANNEPVPEETEEVAPTQMPSEKQEVKIAEPQQTEQPYKPAEIQKADTPADVVPTDVTEEPVAQLPRTASPLYLIGILGLLSLFASAAIGVTKSRMG